MIGGIVRGIVPGASPTPPAPFRLLRLAESTDATWQNNATVRVSASSQDADGWITLALQNPSPAADFPAKMAYRRWPILSPDGSPVDAATMDPARSLLLLIQRHPSGWPGSTAQETIGLGVIDRAGDVTHASAVGLLLGVRTPAAAATYTIIAGSPTAAASASGVTGSRAIASALVTPTQITYMAAAAALADGSAVGGTAYGNTPGTTSGVRALALCAGCNSSAASGPHAVKFRAWYALMETETLPWPTT